MKKSLLIFFFSLFCFSAFSQTVVFSDDFESGISSWNIVGYWGTTTEKAVSGTNSLTDSPYSIYYSGLYGEQTATMSSGIDLTVGLDAYVTFSAQIDLETGFDFMFLEASVDGGSTWLEVANFNGEGFFTWTDYSFSLGAFVCYTDVILRFRFAPDFAYEVDGMYIDDFTITSYPDDVSAPLVLHTPLPLFEGSLLDHTITAQVIDCAGISSTELFYNVDGGSYSSVAGVNTGGDTYEYTIPAQLPGSFVDYYIDATDASPSFNTISSERWHVIAGEHVFYDDGGTATDAGIYVIGELSGTEFAAVKITLDDPTQLVGMIITNYTQVDLYEVDSIQIHVWADDAGTPGADLIEPFYVWPEATLENPYGSTRVDLRDYAAELSGLTGDIYIGYGMPGGQLPAVYSLTSFAGHSKYYSFGFWYDNFYDFEFRAVTTGDILPPAADFSYTGDPAVTFTDLTINTPTSWSWDFDDAGATSTEQNPSHTYTTNGLYNVCLTASNIGGTSTVCKDVAINLAVITPTADFTFTAVGNEVTFTDASSNTPTSWSWDFDDGLTSTDQNPVHTYAVGGNYTVCLTASNTAGPNTKCQQVSIAVAIDELSENGINVFPNPASEVVYINALTDISAAVITLYNAMGQQVHAQVTTTSAGSVQINVKDLAPGNYMLKMTGDNLLAQKMITIE